MKTHIRLGAVIFVLALGTCLLPLSANEAGRLSLEANSPFDRYGNLCWEDEQARLDNFAIALENAPTVTGEIIVYASRISCRDEAKYRGNRARDWVIKRGRLDPKRVVVKDAGFQRDVSTYLIIRPKGSAEYDVPESLAKDKVSIKRCIDKVFAKVLCLNK